MPHAVTGSNRRTLGALASLRLKLVLLLLAFGLIPVACIGGYMLSRTEDLNMIVSKSLQNHAVAINDAIDRKLLQRYLDVQTLALSASAYDPALWRSTDAANPLVRTIDQYVAIHPDCRLSMFVGLDGSVLAVNSRDRTGKPINTGWLYGETFAQAPWFDKALKGDFLTGTGPTGAVVLPPARYEAIQRSVEGDDGFALAFASPVRDSSGRALGVWVNLVGFEAIETIIFDAYKPVDAAGMPSAELTLLDAQGRILVDYDPSLPQNGAGYVRDFDKTIFAVNLVTNGNQAAMAAVKGQQGVLRSFHSRRHFWIVNGYAHSAGVDGFPGFGWSMLVRAPIAEAFAGATRITNTIWVITGVSTVLTIALGWWIGRQQVNPILAMQATLSELADNKTSGAVPLLGRRDELGGMARAVQALKAAIVERNRLEAETAAQRASAEAARAARAAADADAAASQGRVVSALTQGLDCLAKGDLTARITDHFEPAYEVLRRNFNVMSERLQDLVAGIVEDATMLRQGTDEIARAADDLSRRTEQQAASLEQAAAALDEITRRVRLTAEGASTVRTAVAGTRSEAADSGKVVRTAIAAMDAIAESSSRIEQIVGTIDSIAFQTNLLALNAGVEAARAGDAGRGFAVVAQEVRALAQRSAEAAREIKQLIAAASHQVSGGVELVAATGQALDRIAVAVNGIDSEIEGIAHSAKEQATGLQEVNAGVLEMDKTTQQNAAMVEETTSAVRSLAEKTARLVSRSEQFEIGRSAQAVDRPVSVAG